MKNRPNVIVCMCDQLRAFETGCYGNGVVQTPGIDQLATEGIRFEYAVSNNPVCTPARSAMVSGEYGRSCMPHLGNPTELDEFGKQICAAWPIEEREHLPNVTMAEQFRDQGYDTALIGKWHIHPAPGVLGFDYALYPRVNHRHTGQVFVENRGDPFPVDGFSVEFENRKVTEYLEKERDKPFFLFYCISPPHMPIADMPEKYLQMYKPEDVPLRENVFINGNMAYDEEWFRIYLWDFLYYSKRLKHTTESLPKGFDLRSLTALYYGAVSWVDTMVRGMVDALKRNGMYDNTIIIFTADHGDNLGSHHRFNKNILIDESIRVPLVMRGPGVRVCNNKSHVAELVDIMPTALDLCGLEIPSHCQGDSLLPVIQGVVPKLVENGGFIETRAGEIGIRTPDYLYGMQIDTQTGAIAERPKLLYHTACDPFELENLANTGAKRDAEENLRDRLLAWHESTPRLSDSGS